MVSPVHLHRFLKGGPTARDRFRLVFGIPEEAARRGVYRVAAVAWIEDALKVDVAGDAFGVAAVWLLEPGRPGYAQLPGLTVACESPAGGAMPAPVERLVRHVAARLAQTSLDRLLDVLLADPELCEEFATPHSGGSAVDTRADPTGDPTGEPTVHAAGDRSGDAGGGPEAASAASGPPARAAARAVAEPWAEFFRDSAIEQNIAGSFNFQHPVVHVFHGNHECLFVSPAAPSRIVRFHAYPWETARPLADRRRSAAAARGQDAPDRGHRRVSTDMDDLAVITGGADTLADVIDGVLADHRGEIVSVHCSCLPMVMGEDVLAATARLRDDPSIPYLYSDQVTDDQMKVVGALLERARGELRREAAPEGRFDLVGFPDGRATGELVALLESLGLTLNVALVPELDLATYARLLDAECAVFLPSDRHRDLYRMGFEGFPELRPLAPPAPWGLAASERWVAAVAGALGRADAAAAASARERDALAPRWAQLRAATQGARLGFVVDARHVPKLLEPRRFFGLAALAMLREMGFGVDVLAWAPAGAPTWGPALAAAWAAAGDASAASAPAGAADDDAPALAIRPFASPAELDALLGDGGLAAVYSDFFFDHRLTSRGVAPFSARDFEPGFAGALRTFERLAGLCALPFYRRYAPALAAQRAPRAAAAARAGDRSAA